MKTAEMEPISLSFNKSITSNDTKEVPLSVTYLNMIYLPMVATVVVTPAVMIINIIRSTTELHTKYYSLVANLLATDIGVVINRVIVQYLTMILYLLDLNSEDANAVLRLIVIPTIPLTHLIIILLPVTLTLERMIVIVFPYRHRGIMITKAVFSMLAALWGISLILIIMITMIVPTDIVWPLGLIYYHSSITPFFVLPQLASAVLIIITNVVLQYKVILSSRKAKENEKLGNEEEAKRFKKLVQLLRARVKPTVTLIMVGGIDIIGNIVISFMYIGIKHSVRPNVSFYLEQFLMYSITASLQLSHSLVYGCYMKKIRSRLPKCTACQVSWNIHHSRVTTLHKKH